jgi:hypothetical protein
MPMDMETFVDTVPDPSHHVRLGALLPGALMAPDA